MYTFKQLEMFTDMPVLVFVKDEAGKYLWVNKTFLELAGFKSLEDAVGKTDYDLPWAEAAEFLRKNDKHVLDTGKTINLQERINLPGKGELTGNVCKFAATIDGQKCLFGMSIQLD